MAFRVRIDCIRKPDRNNPHRHITAIGGPNDDATRWELTEEAAIQGIKEGKWMFYVHAGGRTVDVIIERHEGREYLKTVADGYRPDNLLSLPECR